MRCDRSKEGITGLEIIIIVVVLLIFMYAAATAIFSIYSTTEKKEAGLVINAVEDESEILVIDGDSEGIEDTGGVIMSVNLISEEPDPSVMGSCLVSVRLLTGSMGKLDMSTAKIIFNNDPINETLSFIRDHDLEKPGWTIAGRTYAIPLIKQDEDIYLEPNEVFALLIYPNNPVTAEKSFSVEISVDNAVPLKQSFRLPLSIESNRIVSLIPG